MKNFAVIFSMLVMSSSAYAQQSAETALSSHTSHVYGGLTFTAGGLGLGADYEYSFHQTYGLGGYVRLYTKDDDKVSGYGVNTFGAFIRPHFHRRSWDLYTSVGFGIAMIDPADNDPRDDETALGPSLGIGVLHQFTDQFALGIENMKIYGWFADDYRGFILDEVSIRGRFSF